MKPLDLSRAANGPRDVQGQMELARKTAERFRSLWWPNAMPPQAMECLTRLIESALEDNTVDTERLDWLEDPLSQRILFGTFVMGGSKIALRSAIDSARQAQADGAWQVEAPSVHSASDSSNATGVSTK